MPKCQHDGCTSEGFVTCYLPGSGPEEPDDYYEYYCTDHASEHGYCYVCGEFWGGVCSFDTGPGACEECRAEIEDDDCDDEPWDDDSCY